MPEAPASKPLTVMDEASAAKAAEDEGKVLAAAKKLPYGERLGHSVWKVRSEACEDIKASADRALSDKDSTLDDFAALLGKAVSDSNPNVMDKGLEAAIAVLSKGSEAHAARSAEDLVKVIMAKGLTARPATLKKAEELLLVLVEQEQQSHVIDGLMEKGFKHKVPKGVAAAAGLALAIFTEFGARVVKPQPVLKGLPPLFESKDAKARDAAKKLTVLMAQWVGRELVEDSLVEKMRDAMKKDVGELLGNLPEGKPKANRLTRKDQAKKAKAEAAKAAAAAAAAPTEQPEGNGAGGAAPPTVAIPDDDSDGDEAVDSYEFAEAVDILKELKSSFWKGLESKKWQERKESLLQLKGLAKTPKIAPGEFSDVNTELKKVISKDSNVVCAAEAVQCIGVLAKGLRPAYRNAAVQFLPLVLDKFKDKNTNMVNSCHGTLDNMQAYCFQLSDVLEDIILALTHQNPKVKQETYKFLLKTISSRDEAFAKKLHKGLLPQLVKGTEEATPGLRDAAMQCLAQLAAKAGSMAPLEKAIAKLDDGKKAKLSSMAQAAISGEPLTSVTPTARSPMKPTVSAPSTRAPSAASSRPSSAGPAKAAKTSAGAALKPPTPKDVPEDPASLAASSISGDEAIAKLAEVLGDAAVTSLKSANWKERLEAMDGAVEKAEGGAAAAPGAADALVYGLAALPGWGEKNFQVLKQCFVVARIVAEQPESGYGKAHAFSVLSAVVEKINDVKLKGSGGEALSAASEAVGPTFIISQLHKKAVKHNNPKVHSESLEWMNIAVLEFGLSACGKGLLEMAKASLESPNAGVRSSATRLLASMHRTLGQSMLEALRPSVKPALMSAIEAEAKGNAEPAPEPVRTSRVSTAKKAAAGAAKADSAAAAAESAKSKRAAANAAAAENDDMLPRADISMQIKDNLIKELSSAVWKERNAAVEQVKVIVAEAGGRIQPLTGDLLPALKQRLTDSNRNLAASVMHLLADICKAMGPPFERQGRMLLDGVVRCLGDNKKQVRDAALAFLDAVIEIGGGGSVFYEIADSLKTLKVEGGKLETFQWLSTKVKQEYVDESKSIASCVKVAVSGIEDKLVTVRSSANLLLELIMQTCGAGVVQASLKELDDKDRRAAGPHVSKVAGGAGAAPPSPTASASSRLSSTSSSTVRASTAKAPSARPAIAGASRRPPSAGASRPGTVKAPAAVAAPAVEVDGAIFVLDDKKESLNNANEESAELEAALSGVTAPHALKLMFAKDCGKHIEACGLVTSCLQDEELREALHSNLDRVFHWLRIRMGDGNTQCLVKTLEAIQTIFTDMEDRGVNMTDFEASIILPALTERSGHNQDRIRQKYRELLAQASSITTRHVKLADALLEGVRSKNNRSKVECVEELGCLVDRHGMGCLKVSGKEKVLPTIAKLVGERDKSLRAAVLGTLAVVYASEGEIIWKQLGNLTPVQKGLIEDRFKSTDKEVRKAGGTIGAKRHQRLAEQKTAAEGSDYGSGAPSPTSAGASSYREEQQTLPSPTAFQVERARAPEVAQSIEFPSHVTNAREDALIRDSVVVGNVTPPPNASMPPSGQGAAAQPWTQPELQQQQQQAHQPPPTPLGMTTPSLAAQQAGGPKRPDKVCLENWTQGMAKLRNSGDLPNAVEGMKMLCFELMEASKEASPELTSRFAESANELVSLLAGQGDVVFDKAGDEMDRTGVAPPSRSCKYVLNTLMQVFQSQQHQLAQRVTRPVVEHLLGTLLIRLTDERVPQLQEGTQLLKALNVLMLKILENSNRTYTFCSLLKLLLHAPQRAGARAGAAGVLQFHDLVVKCLIKLTKALSTFVDELDCAELLSAVHSFFTTLGPEEIRKRGSLEDKPLRMVKTVLHELCKVKGHGIRAPLASAAPLTSGAIIHQYVDLNLQTLESAGLIDKRPAEARDAPPVHRASAQPAAPVAAAAESAAQQGRASTSAASASTTQAVQSPAGPSPVPQHPPNQEAKQQLAAIFKKIGDKNTTDVGLEELYFFKIDNPEVDIAFHLEKTSDAFRRYIQLGLDKVALRQRGTAPAAAAAPNPNPVAIRGRFGDDANGGVRSSTQDIERLRAQMQQINTEMSSRPSTADNGR